MLKQIFTILFIFSYIYCHANLNEEIDKETSIFKNKKEIKTITGIKVRDISELKEIDFDAILDELELNNEESLDDKNN